MSPAVTGLSSMSQRLLLVALLLLQGGACIRAARDGGRPPAPTGLHINLEPNEQLAAGGPLHLGWSLPPDFRGVQRSFWVRCTSVHATGSSGAIHEHECKPSQAIPSCSLSDSIPLEALTGQLSPGTSFAVSVRVEDASGAVSAWSTPVQFATALATGPWPGGAVPIWAANPLQNFVLFRRSFEATDDEHLLHITAHGVPMRKMNAGANATKLLCAYKLWINGMPISAGPGRPTGRGSTIQEPAQLYDSVNITSLLRVGEENVIAIQSWYWTNEQEQLEVPSTIAIQNDHGDRGGVMAVVMAGTKVVAATGDSSWLAYDRGDEALLKALPPPGCKQCCKNSASDPEAFCDFCVITGGRFQLMHEHWNMSTMPFKWQLPGFKAIASEWSSPSERAMGFPRLAPKGSRAIALVDHTPKAIRAVTPSGIGSFRCQSTTVPPVCGWNESSFSVQPHTGVQEAEASDDQNDADATYCYVVDMGSIIQGGINISFSHGVSGHTVSVIASELMIGMNGFNTPTGAVQPNVSAMPWYA